MSKEDTKRLLVATRMFPKTMQTLDSAANRLGRSRASTLEILINLYGPKLHKNTKIPAKAIPPRDRRPGQKRGPRKKATEPLDN